MILSIETSTSVCSIALHESGLLVAQQFYNLSKSHSSLLPTIIDEVLKNVNLSPDSLEAIAVSSGPGSYTGLRIGVSSAKGFAFGLKIPLIAVDSLDVMFEEVRPFLNEELACPMMDARRMEVYCQLRSSDRIYWESKPLIVEPDCFNEFDNDEVLIFGNGAEKALDIINHPSLRFIDSIHPTARSLGAIAYQKFVKEEFEDIAYFEPRYLKEFRTIPQKSRLNS